MNTLLLCLIITAAITYIWDYTPFINEISDMLVKAITKNKIKHILLKKPWSCSLCMSTWITLIILLCLSPQYWYICLAYGWSTQYILEIFNLVDNILTTIFINIEKLINLLRWK